MGKVEEAISVVTASENPVEEAPPPYRVSQAAKKLGVSNKAILDALRNGRLAGFSLNRMWLIPRDAIDRPGTGGSQAT
jgi:excisionase family DNA binding protein